MCRGKFAGMRIILLHSLVAKKIFGGEPYCKATKILR